MQDRHHRPAACTTQPPPSATSTLLPIPVQSTAPPAARNEHSVTTRRRCSLQPAVLPESLGSLLSPLLSPPLNLLHHSLAERRSRLMRRRGPRPSSECCHVSKPLAAQPGRWHSVFASLAPQRPPDVISASIVTAPVARPRHLGNLPAALPAGRMVGG